MPSTDGWEQFFGAVDDLDLSGRRSAAWSLAAHDGLVETLADLLRTRAQELSRRTGIQVQLGPTEAHPGLLDAPRRTALPLALGACSVYVVLTRVGIGAPRVHFCVARAATTTRHPVLASVPGCEVARGPEGRPVLLDARGEELTPDALVLRAFELLVGAHRSTLGVS